MERNSRCVEDSPNPPSFRKIKQLVSGKEENLRAAIFVLEADGFLSIKAGARNANEHHLIEPYRVNPSTEPGAA